MIIVQATMWPGGSQAGAYEVLHATITNQGDADGGHGCRYSAHIIERPSHIAPGYEADVEVENHSREDGLARLLANALRTSLGDLPTIEPSTRLLSRMSIRDVHEFDKLLRGRA